MKKLTLEDVRPLVHGAIRVFEENGKIVMNRFTAYQQDVYDHTKDFGPKARATACVRLAFTTDADVFSFDYDAKITASRKFCFFDVAVDGVLVAHPGYDGVRAVSASVCVKPGAGTHRVEIYFPALFEVRIHNVCVSDGATLQPLCRSRRMLALGDSITQGYDARYPSQSYVNLLAETLDAEVVNQAIGAEIFHPDMLDRDLPFRPDLITVAYGTNDWSLSDTARFTADANEYYARLRAYFPDAAIFAVTPIWRADIDRVTKSGTFEDITNLVRNAAAAQPGVHVIDGAPLIPHLRDVFSDGYLHPNDYGFRFYADALAKEIGKEGF